MDKKTILHLEVHRRLNHPWNPPPPYKVEDSTILFAKERIVEVMEAFRDVLDHIESYNVDRHNEFYRGRRDAMTEFRSHVDRILSLAEREEEAGKIYPPREGQEGDET